MYSLTVLVYTFNIHSYMNTCMISVYHIYHYGYMYL